MQVGANNWKEGNISANICQGRSHLLVRKLNVYAKIMEVEYLRREYLPNTIVTWNATILFLLLSQGNRGMNVYSIPGEWHAQQWVQTEVEWSLKNRLCPDHDFRGILLRTGRCWGSHWNGGMCVRENNCYLVRLLWETWERGLETGELWSVRLKCFRNIMSN